MASQSRGQRDSVLNPCPLKIILGTLRTPQCTSMTPVGAAGVGATCSGLGTSTGSHKVVSPRDTNTGVGGDLLSSSDDSLNRKNLLLR